MDNIKKLAKVIDLKEQRPTDITKRQIVDRHLKKNLQEIYFDALQSIDDLLTEENSKPLE